MQQKWKPGDLVVVVTVNKGLPVWSKQQNAVPQPLRSAWLRQLLPARRLGTPRPVWRVF